MIKIERVSVMNLENAIRGARNPMNSWGRMDSYYDEDGEYVLGENDISLATRLAKAGSDHRKFLRQVMISVDITAPLYWWKEFDTYKIGTVANSCSTMHKITSYPITQDFFSIDEDWSELIAFEDEDGVTCTITEAYAASEADVEFTVKSTDGSISVSVPTSALDTTTTTASEFSLMPIEAR